MDVPATTRKSPAKWAQTAAVSLSQVLPKKLELHETAETYLVPVDFSPASEVGLDYALKLANEKNAHVILLHVIAAARIKRSEGTALDFYRLLKSEARENFSKLAKRKKLKPGKYQTVISRGLSPGVVIAKQAKKLKTDMIVMASHGRSGLQRLFLGSVAERTLRFADCPVLIVKIVPQRKG
jgi:universal stress protein A